MGTQLSHHTHVSSITTTTNGRTTDPIAQVTRTASYSTSKTIALPAIMMTLTPRLLVAMVLLWAVTVVVQSRPSTDSGEPEIKESVESAELSIIIMFPIRQDAKQSTAIEMSDRDLQAVETELAGTKTEPGPSDDQDMVMGDKPPADDPQDLSPPANRHV